MTETIIGGDKTAPIQPAKPGKEKPKDVKIVQAMPAGAMNAMTGRPDIAFFGLGDNSEIYLWDSNARMWRER